MWDLNLVILLLVLALPPTSESSSKSVFPSVVLSDSSSLSSSDFSEFAFVLEYVALENVSYLLLQRSFMVSLLLSSIYGLLYVPFLPSTSIQSPFSASKRVPLLKLYWIFFIMFFHNRTSVPGENHFVSFTTVFWEASRVPWSSRLLANTCRMNVWRCELPQRFYDDLLLFSWESFSST